MLRNFPVFAEKFREFTLTPDAGQIMRLLRLQSEKTSGVRVSIYPLSKIPAGYSLYYKKHSVLPSRKTSMDDGAIRIVPSRAWDVAVVTTEARSENTHRVRKHETEIRARAREYTAFVRRFKSTFHRDTANLAEAVRLLDAVKDAARPVVIRRNGVRIVPGESGPLRYVMDWTLRPKASYAAADEYSDGPDRYESESEESAWSERSLSDEEEDLDWRFIHESTDVPANEIWTAVMEGFPRV